MIFAICGPSSCGKSSIISELKLQGYNILEHQYARELLKLYDITIQDIQEDSKLCDIFHEYLIEYKNNIEIQYISNQSIIFTERTFLDIAIYYLLYHPEIIRCQNIIEIISVILKNNKLRNFLLYSLKLTEETYSQIFYLSKCPNIENDNIRITNLDFVNKQKILFNWIFNSFSKDLSVVRITHSDHLLRLQQIQRFIKKNNYG